MPGNERHHYVPQFYLNGWCTPDEQAQGERLYRYQWKGGRLLVERAHPRSTGSLDRLYSLDSVPPERQQQIEKDFLAGVIETPAGLVLNKMRTSGRGHNLTMEERHVWTRFLMAQRIRSPEIVRFLHEQAPPHLREVLAANPEQYQALKEGEDPETLLEWVERAKPGLIQDFGRLLIPSLILDDRAYNRIIRMEWWQMDFSGAGIPLLSSDHPLVIVPGIDHPGCVIAMPINPRFAFFACPEKGVAEYLAKFYGLRSLAEWLNFQVVRLTNAQVYARDTSLTDFVRAHLAPAE
ncbi:DUF4238 domain-containing protein [Cupriavidus pauculus]|uniref:DUF4238 domain-containing protein n=1 Tax=Cupriavidus pauculus TaxID=82633 RepID=UPI001C9324A2|nr:DUF4238 domain-containing protein [Cupriavidus pauculus]MBY4733697.1 DUF4238 domain-containing protein [Cupriavidus pauculus]